MQLRGSESLVEDLHSTGQVDQFKGGLEEVMDEGVNGTESRIFRPWICCWWEACLFQSGLPRETYKPESLIPD